MSYYNKRRPNYGRKRGNSRSSQGRKGPKKENIHPSRFVQAARDEIKEDYVPKHSFNDFKIHPKLAGKIAQRGFKAPSPIQDQIIPLGLQGRDVIGIANTGTGKTMAFAIPVINELMTNRGSKALIMAPTRELAAQVLDECKSLFDNTGIYWTLLIGGAPMGRQFRDLSRRPELVIGTPGRIKDHLERGSLKLDDFDTVVLDEVDRMLDMGFVHDMRDILSHMPFQGRQSYFFSATIEPKVRSLIKEFSTDPISISVKTGTTTDTVEQDVVKYGHLEEKLQKLHNVLRHKDNRKVLIFDDTRRQVESLSKLLQEHGYNADSIHGGKSQGQRKRALDKFKKNNTNILVATDVAARGIDVRDITHVINYSTPQTYDDYVHRIGRAGRAGRKGFALTFIPH